MVDFVTTPYSLLFHRKAKIAQKSTITNVKKELCNMIALHQDQETDRPTDLQ